MSESERFLTELEFVQCLANPQYLQFLAQSNILEQESFVNYLHYLTYFQTPKYAKYVVYPYCLQILDLLLTKEFRTALKYADTCNFIHTRQYKHWEAYRNEQNKKQEAEALDPNGNIKQTDSQ